MVCFIVRIDIFMYSIEEVLTTSYRILGSKYELSIGPNYKLKKREWRNLSLGKHGYIKARMSTSDGVAV